MEAMKLSAAKSWEESDSCNRHCLSSHGFVMLRGVSETMSYGPMVAVHKAPRSWLSNSWISQMVLSISSSSSAVKGMASARHCSKEGLRHQSGINKDMFCKLHHLAARRFPNKAPQVRQAALGLKQVDLQQLHRSGHSTEVAPDCSFSLPASARVTMTSFITFCHSPLLDAR